jgi:mRNA interferase RelE/StbE
MTYSLEFLPSALKEWQKLGPVVREQFKARLAERLLEPQVPSAALRGMAACYKIKLAAAGYRLVYRVEDQRFVVIVVAVGKREKMEVYRAAKTRAK